MFGNRVRPRNAVFESTSHCQLKCPSCPTANGKTFPVLGKGFLTPELFVNLLESGPRLKRIDLANYGEALLNPNLPEILRLAHERKVDLTLVTGANLNNAREEALEAIVKYQLRAMTCSIDGTSQETYAQYRRGGNFDKVIENIKTINQYKKKYKSKYPRLSWQFIVFGHNEHEMETAKKMAHDLDMDIYFKLSWDAEFSPIRDKAMVRKFAGAASRDEYKEEFGKQYLSVLCFQLWEKPVINWDGKVLGCSFNFWGDFHGDNAYGDFESAVNSDRMRYARQMLMGKAEPRPEIPCTTCSTYLARQRDKQWVTWSDVYVVIPMKNALKGIGWAYAAKRILSSAGMIKRTIRTLWNLPIV